MTDALLAKDLTVKAIADWLAVQLPPAANVTVYDNVSDPNGSTPFVVILATFSVDDTTVTLGGRSPMMTGRLTVFSVHDTEAQAAVLASLVREELSNNLRGTLGTFRVEQVEPTESEGPYTAAGMPQVRDVFGLYLVRS